MSRQPMVPSSVLAARGARGVAGPTGDVPGTRILTAGSGLTGGGDLSANRTFNVNVDDTTIEINLDTLRLKDAGVSAAKLAAALLNNTVLQRSVATGTSSTAIATTAKTVTIASYTLTAGDLIALTLTNGNTATAPTLNINGGGALAVNTGAAFPAYDTPAGGKWLLYYDGTAFLLLNNVDPVNQIKANQITVGQETFSRGFAATTTAMTSGVLRLTYFTAYRTETIASLASGTGATAAATPTTCKMGLYSVDAVTGDLTRVGITANDTAIWAATNTKYTKAMTGTVSVVAGTRYVFACLYVGTTAPVLSARTVPQALASDNNRMHASLSAQTDIPSSITAASLAVAGVQIYGELIP